jgi:hypothetical protein
MSNFRNVRDVAAGSKPQNGHARTTYFISSPTLFSVPSSTVPPDPAGVIIVTGGPTRPELFSSMVYVNSVSTPSKILSWDLDNRVRSKLVYGGDGYLVAKLAESTR